MRVFESDMGALGTLPFAVVRLLVTLGLRVWEKSGCEKDIWWGCG